MMNLFPHRSSIELSSLELTMLCLGILGAGIRSLAYRRVVFEHSLTAQEILAPHFHLAHIIPTVLFLG